MWKILYAQMLKSHADRDRPTLKDADEHTIRNGLFRDHLSKGSSKVKRVLTRFTLDQVDHKKKLMTKKMTLTKRTVLLK
jgi:hypothetical protein